MVARKQRRTRTFRGQRGYVLLTLLVMVALLIISAAAIAPSIAHQVQRDREEELIHRGMQYRRAIRAFAKRTGTFPHRLEQLEDTNGTRFLRRQYKDPMTGGAFRLLHMRDIHGPVPKLMADPAANAGTTGGVGGDSSSPTPDGASADNSGSKGLNPNSPAGQLAAMRESAAQQSEPVGPVILGVASRSTKTTIREFEHKNHYNQWLFFYSANYDGSLEVKGPTPTSPIMPKTQVEAANPPVQGAQ